MPVNLGPDLLGGDWGEMQRANGSDTDADPPIFATLRSAWLSADGQEGAWLSSEIEAGWERAESVEASPTPAPVDRIRTAEA